MIQRNHRGQFARKRKTTRWEYLVCFSIAGGILCGMYLDSYRIEHKMVYVAEAHEPEEQVVLIEVVYDWTEERIEQEIRATFPEEPNTAVAVAWAESELKYWAENPEMHRGCRGSFGLMQVACVHNKQNPQALKDIQFNLKKARAVYDESKARTGNGWLPWGAYTDGRYKEYLQ